MTRDKDEAAHPAPHRRRTSNLALGFAVWGSPAAWMVQLTATFALATSPCFQTGDWIAEPGSAHGWLPVIQLVALLIALAALALSFVLLRRTRDETGGDEFHLFETGHGRTRFIALWGIAFAATFSLLIAINIATLAGVPPCEA